MPGIFGIISKRQPQQNINDVGLMVDCLRHEDFYVTGTYKNDQFGLYAGWATLPGAFDDCMPLFNEARDLVLLFAGENFVDEADIAELGKRGHEFESTNASYLIHLYEEDEVRFLENLNGWFSGVLLDLRQNKVIIFNDRYGMGRLYFYEGKDEFLFASEAKALLKVRPQLRAIDLKSLGEFFVSNCILENRSLFSNVSLLPGGSEWKFRSATDVEKRVYFKPADWESQESLDKEVFYDTLRETFRRILPRYLRENGSIGVSMTSGLDTRVILSNMDHRAHEMPSYTFTGMYRDTLDAKIARKVAETCEWSHESIPLGKDFLSSFPGLAEKTVYVTDGCHNLAGAYDIYFNEIARKISPVRLTGKFGSEILGNMSVFKKPGAQRSALFDPEFHQYLEEARETFWKMQESHRLTFAAFVEAPYFEYGRMAAERSQVTYRSPYMDNDLVKLMYQAPPNTRESREIRLRLIEDGSPTLRKIMTDRGTAGEAHHIFSRVPQLLLYTLFKSEYVYLYQLPGWLGKIDKMFSPLHLDRLFLGRYNFGHHRLWFRDELSSYVRDVLLDRKSKSRPYLNEDAVESMVDGHINGTGNYASELNKVMTAELVHRLLVEE